MDYSRYQTGMQRFGAAIIDGLVFLPFFFIHLSIPDENIMARASWGVVITLFGFTYTVFGHYKYGQTIGKWVTKVKVVDVSETRGLTLKQAILRDSFYILAEIIALIYFAVLLLNGHPAEVAYNDYRIIASDPATYWMVLELITMLFNKKRRAVHDFLAKSVVVKYS